MFRTVLINCLLVSFFIQSSVSFASKERYQALESLAKGMHYLETLYVDPGKVVYSEMAQRALEGVVKQLDPHTVLMPRKAFDQLTIDTQGKFGGIGIIVSSESDRLIIVRPIEGTPAEKAGILPGDEIVEIDGHAVKEMKGSDSTELMRGKPDTEIKLKIRRSGEGQLLNLTLIREIIKIRSVRSSMLTRGVLYTRISSFQDNTADELLADLNEHKASLKGLVLDLRDNPGGLLDQAVRIADLFIESGLIVSTVGRTKKDVEREFAHKRGTFSSIPIVTLINGGSASASEIVAGALQDHERSLVMGTTSFGKGSVQTLISLPDRSGLKVTVARYYTPKDRSIQAKGIKPDVTVPVHKLSERAGQKESDLERHIKGHDLSRLSEKAGISKEITSWPALFSKDRQLSVAYTYLRGWRGKASKSNLDSQLQ